MERTVKFIILSFILTLPIIPISAQDSMRDALILLEGAANTKDPNKYNKAISALKTAAEEGFGEAAYTLGDVYYYGYKTTAGNVKADEAKACEWYEKAIELGYEEGILKLGRIYLYGFGTAKKNPEKAFQTFSTATEKHIYDAKYFLAYCYFIGFGVEEDENKAFEIVKNYYDEMGKYYDNSIKHMVAWFLASPKYKKYFYNEYYRPKSWSDAAELGDTDPTIFNLQAACCIWCRMETSSTLLRALRIMYENDWTEVRADVDNTTPNMYKKYKAQVNYKEIGEKLFSMKDLKDEEQGEITYYLAYFRENNKNGFMNYDTYELPKTLNYLTFSVDKGYAPAMRMLADWYEKGYGVSKNLIKAKTLREKADAIEKEKAIGN